ncbi:unnamed protein product [Rhizophagus irregularis]|nr:unnamed protein product [Rhizophagus irregularis]
MPKSDQYYESNAHVTKNSDSSVLSVALPQSFVFNSSGKKLPDVEMSTSVTFQVSVPSTSSYVLERFPYLSLKYSIGSSDKFVFNSSVPCPICNKDHESENIKKGIGSQWGLVSILETELIVLNAERLYIKLVS